MNRRLRFVDSLARPGGNAIGFILFEHGISENAFNISADYHVLPFGFRGTVLPN